MSKLIFSADTNILLHQFKAIKSSWRATDSLVPSFKSIVDVWDVVNNKLLYRTRGYLLGLSDNGKTFLTQLAEDDFSVIETTKGNTFPLDKGLVAPVDYSALHYRFYLSQDMSLRDVFGEYPNQKVSLPDPVTNMELGPYLFVAFWFDIGDGIEGAYGQAIDLLTGEVSYTFSVNRHAVNVPIHYSTIHNMLFVGQNFVAHDLTTGEKLKDHNKTVKAVQQTIKKVGHKINGVGFHPDGKQMALSLTKGAIEIWDMSKNRRVKTLTKSD